MLYSILEIIFRHRWRYLVLLVVLPLIAALVCIPLYPKSSAAELIWVQDQNLLNTAVPAYETWTTPAGMTQGDFEQYIQTQAFADAVGKKLVKNGVSPDQATAIASGLSGGLVATTTGNNLLLLSYTCTRPSLCPVVLSLSWEVYEAYSTSNVNSQLKLAEKADQSHVSQAQQQLDSANAALSGYLSQHPNETVQTTDDPALSQLLQTVSSAQQALQSAQSQLTAAQAQASTNQISISSLYSVVDPAHSLGGHLSRLPTKQMMMAAALFWAFAAASLVVTSRIERVVRHPNQLAAALGLEVAAVMQPIPASRSTTLTLPGRSRGATA